ncbi:MAG: hypothetical protein AAF191_06735 [Verrucomicrobiota bacterium]
MAFNDRIISIDFGNSYCKVGLRHEKDGASALLRDGGFNLDDGNFCIPTIIGQREKDGLFRYGTSVFEEGAGVHVYRNWKPLFFEDSMEASQDSLRNALRADGHDVEELALGYFSWLRRQVAPICRQEFGISDPSEIPARITLPAFGNVSGAREKLEALLEESGWNLADVGQAIPEPVANAIGTFSQGRNAVWNPPQPGSRPQDRDAGTQVFPHYGRMFEGSPLLWAMQAQAKDLMEESIHWVLVADLGGYTLDFAMLGFNLEDVEDLDRTFSPDSPVSDPPRFARLSYPFGVMDLDQMVYDVLPDDQQNAFRVMMSDVDQRRLETFHRRFYRHFQPMRVGRTEIGGGSEIDTVKDAVDSFNHRIQELAQTFLDTYQFPKVHQLVLTGGGSNIPGVRRALIDQLEPDFTHGARNEEKPEKEEFLSTKYMELTHNEVRGATATGGTNVYFEFLAA